MKESSNIEKVNPQVRSLIRQSTQEMKSKRNNKKSKRSIMSARAGCLGIRVFIETSNDREDSRLR